MWPTSVADIVFLWDHTSLADHTLTVGAIWKQVLYVTVLWCSGNRNLSSKWNK